MDGTTHSRARFAEKYQLCKRVGEGGMGVVYRAETLDSGHTVAVKVLRAELAQDAAMRRRFDTEALAMSRFAHPHVTRLIERSHTPDGLPCMILEWVEGRGLSQLLEDSEPPTLLRIVRLVGQLLDGLGAAHLAGVTHGDVKSNNVMVTLRDGHEAAKLMDFGLAQLDSSGTRRERIGETEVCGTPDYLAPELIAGAAASPLSDLYAVGVILYELLTGGTPFAGGQPCQVLARQLHDEPVPPSLRCPERVIPPALESVVLRALAKDPALRFTAAAELRAALCEAVAGTTGAEWRCAECDTPLSARHEECPRCAAVTHPFRLVEDSAPGPTRVMACGTPPGGVPVARRRSASRRRPPVPRLAAGT